MSNSFGSGDKGAGGVAEWSIFVPAIFRAGVRQETKYFDAHRHENCLT